MNTKHTPGPWYWSGDRLRTKASMGRPANHYGGWIVDYHSEGSEDKRWGDNEANRRLIAAAPELVSILDMITFTGRSLGDEWVISRAQRQIAADLLARIKGE